MASEPPPESRHIQTVRAIYRSFLELSLPRLARLIDPRIVVTFDGSSRLAGRYDGIGASLGLVARASRVFLRSTLAVLEVEETGPDSVLARVRVAVETVSGVRRTVHVRQSFAFGANGKVSATTVTVEEGEDFDRLFA